MIFSLQATADDGKQCHTVNSYRFNRAEVLNRYFRVVLMLIARETSDDIKYPLYRTDISGKDLAWKEEYECLSPGILTMVMRGVTM